jgi:hypothetical protein
MGSIVPGTDPFGMVPVIRDQILNIYKFTNGQRINFKHFLSVLNLKY